MTRDDLLAQIRRLPVDERLELIEQVWDEISPGELPIPDWHREELDSILDDPNDVPNIPWEKARKRLGIPPG